VIENKIEIVFLRVLPAGRFFTQGTARERPVSPLGPMAISVIGQSPCGLP
jgi:hypothetical protein